MALFGIGAQKPRHYREMLKVAWENRDQLPFAWRILADGVCDGCALGTSGLKDWTLPGTHLCMVRLELMRLNTAPALDPRRSRMPRRCRATSRGAARAGPAAGADAAACRRPWLPRRRAGTTPSTGSPREAARGRPAAHGVLPDLARHHQRGVLRRPEGRAIPRAPTTSTTPPACVMPRPRSR